ncbi:MAG: tetratricopeptide repeat protein [Rhodospirillales bacterium]|nr:tetratricopeptide repeat protein [Rhodospirillales bacterium]
MSDKPATAEALFEAGQLMEAQAAFWALVRTNPQQPQAWRRLGEIALRLRQYGQAYDFFGNAYDFDPDNADIRLGLGQALVALGRFGEAIPNLKKASLSKATAKEASRCLAQTFQETGQIDQAISAWQHHLTMNENDSAAMMALADLLMRRMRFEEADELLYFVCLLETGNPLPLVMLGNARLARQDKDSASALYRQALMIAPGHAPALFNLGNLAMSEDDFDEAARLFAEARANAPDDVRLGNNLAIAFKEMGRIEDAEEILREALRANPNFADAHWNLATLLFLKGRWREGFQEAEWRWEMQSFSTPKRDFGCPPWDGKPVEDGILLVHAEQGLGDAFQFVRYIPKLAALASNIVLEADPKQTPLFQRSFPMVAVVPRGQDLPRAKAHVAMLSLPKYLDAPYASGAYLKADPDRVAYWKKRLGQGPWIGLSWQGNPGFHADRRRSPGLGPLLPLLDVPGIRLASLQHGVGREQLLRLSEGPLDLGDEDDPAIGGDFDATAAIVEALDLVVTSDTAIAHLAGALGKPLWLLLPYIPDWRWQMSGESSVWYPKARLFRQPKPGDWATPVAAIAEGLKGFHV